MRQHARVGVIVMVFAFFALQFHHFAIIRGHLIGGIYRRYAREVMGLPAIGLDNVGDAEGDVGCISARHVDVAIVFAQLHRVIDGDIVIAFGTAAGEDIIGEERDLIAFAIMGDHLLVIKLSRGRVFRKGGARERPGTLTRHIGINARRRDFAGSFRGT